MENNHFEDSHEIIPCNSDNVCSSEQQLEMSARKAAEILEALSNGKWVFTMEGFVWCDDFTFDEVNEVIKTQAFELSNSIEYLKAVANGYNLGNEILSDAAEIASEALVNVNMFGALQFFFYKKSAA